MNSDVKRVKVIEERIKDKEDEISDAKKNIKIQKEELVKTTVRITDMTDTLAVMKEVKGKEAVGGGEKDMEHTASDQEKLDRAIGEKRLMLKKLIEVVEDQGRRKGIQSAKREKMSKQVEHSEEQIKLQERKMLAQEDAIKELVAMVSEQSQSLEAFQTEHFPQKNTSLRRPEFIGHAIWLQQQQENTPAPIGRRGTSSTESSKDSDTQSKGFGSTDLAKPTLPFHEKRPEVPSAAARRFTDASREQPRPQGAAPVPTPTPPERHSSRFIMQNNIVCTVM